MAARPIRFIWKRIGLPRFGKDRKQVSCQDYYGVKSATIILSILPFRIRRTGFVLFVTARNCITKSEAKIMIPFV